MVKKILSRLLRTLYRVEVKGLENFDKAGERVLIVANHTSFLDPLLLGVFLPDQVTFAINTHISQKTWVKPFLKLAHAFSMDPTNPLASKTLIKHLKANNKTVIFPEGRITVTGALMKIYDGTAMVADKSQATLLPVRIDGAQFTHFSRMQGRLRQRLFPKITINILPPTTLSPPDESRGRERRKYAGRQLADIMTEMMFQSSGHQMTLTEALIEARQTHGGKHEVVEDLERKPLTYNKLLTGTFCLGQHLADLSKQGDIVGVLLPNSGKTVVTMMGLMAYGRVPAMLNYTSGSKGIISACETAQLPLVISSKRFIEVAGLEDLAAAVSQCCKLVYLEDIAAKISSIDKIKALFHTLSAHYWYPKQAGQADDPAIVLFTSGSEGVPKGVVLSHANLLANLQQIAARIDFNPSDIILNTLPIFHSFGLTAGTLLPLMSGMKTFLYPSPLHYKVIPEIAYEIDATILFGTNTFLAGYAQHAHPYDFYSLRHVVAGAEKLQDSTVELWASKFGLRILEGYGATETAPVACVNTPLDYRRGTVGRLLPSMKYHLEPVTGVTEGARLHVTGPNIMLGYMLHDQPGQIIPTESSAGTGWHDTGDIVAIDEDGFVTICGRAKRFAKIGGEMVSLTVTETLINQHWPAYDHAIVTQPDPKKGEQLVLLTNCPDITRSAIAKHTDGLSELYLPRKIIQTDKVPLTGTGKIDYLAVTEQVSKEMAK